MCGRYSLGVSAEVLAQAFRLASVPQLLPRYNIAPTQAVPIIRVERDGQRHLHLLHWGLIPWWADDPKVGNRMINARSESADKAPAFRQAFQQRRCLIPADAFYEWQKRGTRKQPYLVRMRDGRPFAFAGLWERWRGKGDEKIESFTILTTEPNEVTSPLHDRMPAIVDPADYEKWLDPRQQSAEALKEMLRPPPADQMEAFPISARVNKPENDDPEIVKPLQPVKAESPASQSDLLF
jgi:putative SOS response-associated peptidase YedK